MNLSNFLNSQNYNPGLKKIILDIQAGSIQVYQQFNEAKQDIFGSSGQKNVQDEDVQKLDLLANDIFIRIFRKNMHIHSILSEENERILTCDNDGAYIIAMDPLDGSSNIDVNIPVGSIFSILKNTPEGFLQKGSQQQLACYVIYGTATMMVFALNKSVFGFTLNTKTKEYNLTHSNIRIPVNGNIFSINEGNFNSLETPVKQFLDYCKQLGSDKKRTHTGRFIGSLVADFHRNMLKGGIFIYPKTADKPHGQLRLIYECNPIAFIAKNANGESTNLNNSILDVKPIKIHERSPFVVGSKNMVARLLEFYH